MKRVDLERAGIYKADAVFLFTNRKAEDIDLEDQRMILRAMQIRVMSPETEMYAQVVRIASKQHPLWQAKGDNTTVVGIDEIRMMLCARSCLTPGFGVLITNLVTSFDYEIPESNEGVVAKHWLQEYCYGLGYQMYPVKIPSIAFGISYTMFVQVAYKRFGIMVIGLEVGIGAASDKDEVQVGSGFRRMLLNPGHAMSIMKGDVAFVLAKNAQHAQCISRWDESEHGEHELQEEVAACKATEILNDNARSTAAKEALIEAYKANVKDSKNVQSPNRKIRAESSATKAPSQDEEVFNGEETEALELDAHHGIVSDATGMSGHIIVHGSSSDMASFRYCSETLHTPIKTLTNHDWN